MKYNQLICIVSLMTMTIYCMEESGRDKQNQTSNKESQTREPLRSRILEALHSLQSEAGSDKKSMPVYGLQVIALAPRRGKAKL